MTCSTVTIVILTFNSAATLAATISQAQKISNRFFIVDSGSSDSTLEILRSLGLEAVQRPFVTYGDQRNWAIAQVQSQSDWQLHLDADEVLDDRAVSDILRVLEAKDGPPAYLIRRRDYFLGRMLRFSGLNPWHLRLFRFGAGRCEDRLYDQHFVSDGATGRLYGYMHDHNGLELREWISRHNRWSDMEAREIAGGLVQSGTELQARIDGDPRERTRWFKKVYYRLPMGGRAVLYFMYRYFLRLGFLDGRSGFYFAFFQGLWFRLLVDAKLYEIRQFQAKNKWADGG